MRWPLKISHGGDTPPPPAQLPADRPSTVTGFLSDLSRNPNQAFTFVMTVGAISLIATICFVGAFLAIAFADRGTKGVPLHYILPIGISGASLLTLATTLITAWIRRLARGSQGDAASDHTQDGKRLGVETRAQCLQSQRQRLWLRPTTLAAAILGPRG